MLKENLRWTTPEKKPNQERTVQWQTLRSTSATLQWDIYSRAHNRIVKTAYKFNIQRRRRRGTKMTARSDTPPPSSRSGDGGKNKEQTMFPIRIQSGWRQVQVPHLNFSLPGTRRETQRISSKPRLGEVGNARQHR